jgi:cytochrome d ubiquinol oxidase subunit II
MGTAWYVLLAWMLITYVVLDGFDLGAGALHLTVARTDEERRTILGAIGPVWDGNEVWLVASGGLLVYAFPRAYAAAFSGFYLPLMIVLWLLIVRGLSIEMRGQSPHPLWRALCDAGLAVSSIGLALTLGVSLGNVLRGVPLDETGFFHAPLFTDFRTSAHPGAFDWYTLSVGALALTLLALHGALYLIWKTEGPVAERCRRLAPRLLIVGALLAVAVAVATERVHPSLARTVLTRPLAWPFALAVPGGGVAVALGLRRRRELSAFLGSCALEVGLLGSVAAGVYPLVLPSTLASDWSLTVGNAAAGGRGLVIGLWWWTPAAVLAVGYFVYLFRAFRGKVRAGEH